VEHSLRSVRLFDGGIADKRVAKYSGGMKRRLSVAISLIGDPKVYLLVFTYLTIIQENI
jgi:ABC-type multidrug transport system ATPase subunit